MCLCKIGASENLEFMFRFRAEPLLHYADVHRGPPAPAPTPFPLPTEGVMAAYGQACGVHRDVV